MKLNSLIKYHKIICERPIEVHTGHIREAMNYHGIPPNHKIHQSHESCQSRDTTKSGGWNHMIFKSPWMQSHEFDDNGPLSPDDKASSCSNDELDRCCSSLIIDSEFCHHSVIYCHLEANLEIFPTYQFVMTTYMLSNPVRAKSWGGPLYQYSAVSMTHEPWAVINDSYVWVTCMAHNMSLICQACANCITNSGLDFGEVEFSLSLLESKMTFSPCLLNVLWMRFSIPAVQKSVKFRLPVVKR